MGSRRQLGELMGSDGLGIALSAPSLVDSGTQREVALEVLQGNPAWPGAEGT